MKSRLFQHSLKDRVRRGIAGCGTERYRILTDGLPVWAALQVFRFAEREYGAVSMASLFTSCWRGIWDRDEEGNMVVPKPPGKEDFVSRSREDRLRRYLRWKIGKAVFWVLFCDTHRKVDLLKGLIKQFKIDAVFMHLNRGCEGTALGTMEQKSGLVEAGIPVFTYEGNMSDMRDFDYGRTLARMEAFLENQGLERFRKEPASGLSQG